MFIKLTPGVNLIKLSYSRISINTGKSPVFTGKSTRVQSIVFRISVKTEDFPIFMEIRDYESFIKLTPTRCKITQHEIVQCLSSDVSTRDKITITASIRFLKIAVIQNLGFVSFCVLRPNC